MRYFKQHPFVFFLLLHFFVWSLIPLLRRSLPMDSIEAVVWGQYCDWGTNKHPPLSGWLAYLFYDLSGGRPYAVYALSQLCVLGGFIYIFKLAECFFDRQKAVLSVMLLEGVIYYGFSTPEFNVNVVSLALWPAVAYYFYRSITRNRLSDWALLGVTAGLNLLNKYVGGFLLASLGLALLFEPDLRKKLKTFGPYLSAFVCFSVVFPHVVWLYEHDFFVLDYFLGRSGQGETASWFGHIVYPMKFLCAQILFSLGTLLIYFISTRKAEGNVAELKPKDHRLIVWLGIAPFVLMFCFSALTGVKMKSMWGFPVLYMLGIVLWTFFPRPLNAKIDARMQKGVYVLMALMVCALISVFALNKSDKVHMDAVAYGEKLEQLWRAETDRPFEYVAGDVWWADNASLFAPAHPKPIIWGDVRRNPWFSADDPKQKGVMLIASGVEEYEHLVAEIGGGSKPRVFEIELKNLLGQTKNKKIYYGFFLEEIQK